MIPAGELQYVLSQGSNRCVFVVVATRSFPTRRLFAPGAACFINGTNTLYSREMKEYHA